MRRSLAWYSAPVSFVHVPSWADSITTMVGVRFSVHTGVHHMPEAFIRSDPSLLSIERPRCPKCQGRMMLARIEPGPAHSDLRTFECQKCEHVHKMLVEDPLKSANTDWTAGGLAPPK